VDGDESGDLYQPSSGRLVEILREENASLKQELESYYQRVRKLQKVRTRIIKGYDIFRVSKHNVLARRYSTSSGFNHLFMWGGGIDFIEVFIKLK